MTLSFVCQSCDESIELEYEKLLDLTKGLKCPGCGKKLSSVEVDEFVTSLDELLSQVAALRKRFVISFDVDAEDLPAPFESDRKRPAADEEEDDDEETDEEDDDLGDDEGSGEDEDDRY